ncbi:MAG: hypothetical protein ACOYKZ_02295 [Chlamydiia bacterium]
MIANLPNVSCHSLEDMFCRHLLPDAQVSRNGRAWLSQSCDLKHVLQSKFATGDECSHGFWVYFQRALEQSQSAKAETLELVEFSYDHGRNRWRTGLDSREHLVEAFQRLGDQIDQVMVTHSRFGMMLPHESAQHTPTIDGLLAETWVIMKPLWTSFLKKCLQAPVREDKEMIAGKERPVLTIDLRTARVVADLLKPASEGTSSSQA